MNQIKQTALKSGFNFTTYGKFTDTSSIEDLQTRKPLSPIWVSSSISRKRQATGFEPLHHHNFYNSFSTISLPINTIFLLSVVYGIMGACLYYVVTHVCMYECMHECMNISVYVRIYVCIYQNQKIKSKIFYSLKPVTLININNISNT